MTHDAADFRRLVGRTHIHPGLVVILEAADRATTERMVRAFLDFVEEKREQEDPATYMVNRVVEATSALVITTYKLPEYE